MATILIADDAAFMRMTIKNMLVGSGHTVIGEAADGEETLKMFKKLKPDLIILDITMPGMNGIEALKLLREMDPKAKIIICSALGQVEIVAKAIQHGAEDFIVKPFEASKLLAAIEKVMR